MTERSVEDRLAGVTEQIRRDLAVLKGPPQYVSEREFYEQRIASMRALAVALAADVDLTRR